jgi:hypothetical protein
MVEELEGPSGLQQVTPWRDTSLATMTQKSTACVDLLSHVVVCFVLGLLCGGIASACYVLLLFLYDIVVLLLLFKKKIQGMVSTIFPTIDALFI